MRRSRWLAATHALLALLIILMVTGTTLAFGGNVWWARPALAGLTSCILLAFILRSCLMGRWSLLKSPLAMLGMLAVGLGVLQITPLPGRLASVLSSRSREAHALATLPDLALKDDPGAQIPEAVADRTPATLDRPATLRWVVGAAGCLALFCVCSHYSDRIGHSRIIWGSVVAGFFLMTAFGMVQITSGISGLYGTIEPGSGRPGMPTLNDLSSTPGTSLLRPLPNGPASALSWSLPHPQSPFQFGPMLGGAGAYLALAALGLPLSLGLSLQMMAPRGSRQTLMTRLRDSGGIGLLIMMILMTGLGAGMVGYLAGPILVAPFVVGILLVGVPGAWSSGLRWTSVSLTLLTLLVLAGGVVTNHRQGNPTVADPMASTGVSTARTAWTSALGITRDFPLVGSGLGTYPVIAPYYKSQDLTTNTAGSSLVQWWVESGFVGMGLLGLAAIWSLWRLPGAVRSVQSGDRTLAFMLIGSGVCFLGFSMIHWSIEMAAIAIAACAVGGTFNRWLAGATDLFVEAAS